MLALLPAAVMITVVILFSEVLAASKPERQPARRVGFLSGQSPVAETGEHDKKRNR